MTPLLKTEGLTVTFGGLNANDGVDLIVEAGSFVGLIGPNGAGKTTFIDAITGYVPTSSGTANFDGHDLSVLKPHKRSQLGLVRTFQSLELFEDLSVRDNLLVAAHLARWYTLVLDILHLRQQTPEVDARVDWALEVVGLSGQADVLPTDLSHGQRKLVGVARALAPNRSWSCSMSRLRASIRRRAVPWAATYEDCSTTTSPCSSLTTTWVWCSVSVTTST